MKILALNAGSSSQKSALYDLDSHAVASFDAAPPLWWAYTEWGVGAQQAKMTVGTAHGAHSEEQRPMASRADHLDAMLATLWSGDTKTLDGPHQIEAVGHRVVHGGPDYSASIPITPDVTQTIARLAAFAPEHNPAAVEGIEAVTRTLGATPQVAVFDTAFHSTLPEVARVYPGPYSWYEQGIRRYGFHGISHHYLSVRAAQLLARDPRGLRLITCHLGGGCSLAAVRDGLSIETTMGFTPLEGVMMGSRSGSVDPGILLYLLRQPGATADTLSDTLNHQSGLKGVSGISSDIRPILQARDQGDTRAHLALDIYVHRLRAGIGAMLAALGGVDALIFGGGVGENVPLVREQACAAFEFLGLRLDTTRNAQVPSDQDRDVSAVDSPIRALVVHTQEDWMIACDCWNVIHPRDEAPSTASTVSTVQP